MEQSDDSAPARASILVPVAVLTSAVLMAIGLVLYAYGWSLETDALDAGGSAISNIDAGTAAIRQVGRNIVLQGKLLWWADRALAAGFAAGVIAAILHRQEK